MPRQPRAFTLIELVMVSVVVVILALLMLPAMKQRWNASGLTESINNVRQIMAACNAYRIDHNGYTPMRGTGYSNGTIVGGWSAWNFAGKNCDAFWLSYGGGTFDESAHARFLNSYLQGHMPPVPSGYVNVGAGATWTFNDGTPTLLQRQTFAAKVCRSPGDVATRQHNWPSPTPSISGYDDIGTSYLLNMKWWSQPGGPASFTAKYNAGSLAISRLSGAMAARPASDFVWIADQIGSVVSEGVNGVMGEFGGTNHSVLGFLDGRSRYMPVTPGALSGPGYTFGITWP